MSSAYEFEVKFYFENRGALSDNISIKTLYIMIYLHFSGS